MTQGATGLALARSLLAKSSSPSPSPTTNGVAKQ
jgi:hypothetical protein